MVFSGGALGSSLGGPFLMPRITYFDGLTRVAQKRETGSIESERDSRVDLVVSVDQNGDSGILRFTQKLTCSHFLSKCHLSV